MATFLLTGKAQKALRRTPTDIPLIIPPFDGWYVDILFLRRRKAVLVTHERTFISFVGYLAEMGGYSRFSDWFLNRVAEFMEINRANEVDKVVKLLSRDATFHKTRSRKVIGHMTDFKNLILNGRKDLLSGDQEDLLKLSAWLHEVPVRMEGNQFGRPKELFFKVLGTNGN